MGAIEPLQFRRVHLAILFGCAVVFKGLWKYITGSHMVVFSVCVGGLYLARLMKPKDALDEEIEKLDAALTTSSLDGDETAPYVRPTKFIIPEADRGLFTPRQRQYSSLLGGTQAQRRKFLRKKGHEEDINVRQTVDGSTVAPAATLPATTSTADPVPEPSTHRRRRPKRAPLD